MFHNSLRLALFLSFCTIMVTGCVRDDRMYCHDTSYTMALYKYLKDDPDYQSQLELMNEYFDQALSDGKKVAPGAYAHYALLMSKVGDEGEMKKFLEKEKAAFPDSIHYIDFLINFAKEKQVNNEKTNSATASSNNDITDQSVEVNNEN